MIISTLGMNCDEDCIFTILILLKKMKNNKIELTRCDHKNGIYETQILCFRVTMFLEVPNDTSTLQIMLSLDKEVRVETFDYKRCKILIEREGLDCKKIWDILVTS